MFTIKNYVRANSLEEAYDLNKKRNNVILGGICWLKMGNRNINTAIDLTKLGLDKIEEDINYFYIGCMCTLRQLEINKNLNSYFNGVIARSLKNIVGVQFRNCATIGGSIYSRFGFSDILTSLLSLDTYVELYNGGVIPLYVYKDMEYDDDILVKVIIKKDNRKAEYLTYRNTTTDIPTIAVAVSKINDRWNIVIGARPQKAKIIDKAKMLSRNPSKNEIDELNKYISNSIKFGSNMRASEEYRKILSSIFIKRAINKIEGGSYEN